MITNELLNPNPAALPAAIPGQTVCIVCGCSDLNACIDQASGEPCGWVELDGTTLPEGYGICTYCAEVYDDVDGLPAPDDAVRREYDSEGEGEEPLVQLVSEHEADRFLRARRAGA